MNNNKQQQVLVDANVWIAFFDMDDTHTQKATLFFQTAIKNHTRIFITDYIIQEVVTVLLYKNKSIAVERFMKYIEQEEYITITAIDAALVQQTIEFAQKHSYKPKLSLTDWSLALMAFCLPVEVVTFDVQLANCITQTKS